MLNGAEGAIAIGISTRRDSRLGFLSEPGIGGTMFLWETNQGFDNDFFHNFGFRLARAGVNFKFWTGTAEACAARVFFSGQSRPFQKLLEGFWFIG